ncbi:MAG: hypothetical protein JWP01_554 [Myxococcales bacterium]|nr:hypothetical protein [Myxococcales bacterium]
MNQLTIGGLLRTSMHVWKTNFVPFTAIALVLYLPALIVQLVTSEETWNLLMIPLGLLLSSMIAAAVTYGVIMELNGTRPSVRKCVTIGLAQIGPVIAVMLLSTLAMWGGFILLVVPGLIVAMMTYVVVPVAVIEKPGIRASLRRSRELVNGHKGKLFVTTLVLLVPTGLDLLLKQSVSETAMMVVRLGINALSGLFGALLSAVAYTLIRQEKEGTQVPELATAFARLA